MLVPVTAADGESVAVTDPVVVLVADSVSVMELDAVTLAVAENDGVTDAVLENVEYNDWDMDTDGVAEMDIWRICSCSAATCAWRDAIVALATARVAFRDAMVSLRWNGSGLNTHDKSSTVGCNVAL